MKTKEEIEAKIRELIDTGKTDAEITSEMDAYLDSEDEEPSDKDDSTVPIKKQLPTDGLKESIKAKDKKIFKGDFFEAIYDSSSKYFGLFDSAEVYSGREDKEFDYDEKDKKIIKIAMNKIEKIAWGKVLKELPSGVGYEGWLDGDNADGIVGHENEIKNLLLELEKYLKEKGYLNKLKSKIKAAIKDMSDDEIRQEAINCADTLRELNVMNGLLENEDTHELAEACDKVCSWLYDQAWMEPSTGWFEEKL